MRKRRDPLAVVIAIPMVQILGHYAARFSVRAKDMSLDFSLVWFGVGLAVVAAVFLAFIPRLPSLESLQNKWPGHWRTRASRGGSSRRLRIFAIMQITASFLLLAGSAVLMRTLYELEKTRPPFDTTHVLAVNLPAMSYGKTPEQVQEFYREVLRRVGALPGVEHVSTGASVPWRDGQALNIQLSFAVQGSKRENGQADLRARFRSISPGYFGTLGVPTSWKAAISAKATRMAPSA